MIKDNSDASWEKYGNTDPYYGVLSAARFRKENLDEAALTEFFQSGQEHIDHVLQVAERHFGPFARRESALDFGCGVGRLAIPLARTFGRVTGVDVSRSMLDEAGKNCALHEVTNVELVLSDDALSRVSGSFDLVHSVIVLQHIPVKRGERIISRLVDLVGPGGVGALQMPFTRDTDRMTRFRLLRRFAIVRESINFARRNFTPLNMLANMCQGRPWNQPYMQMNNYDLNRVLLLLHRHGIKDLAVEFTDSDGQIGAFLYFKKP